MPKSDDDILPVKTEESNVRSVEKNYPKKIRMTRLYGYDDDLGRRRMWKEGDVIANEAEVKLLVDREPDPDHRPFVAVEE